MKSGSTSRSIFKTGVGYIVIMEQGQSPPLPLTITERATQSTCRRTSRPKITSGSSRCCGQSINIQRRPLRSSRLRRGRKPTFDRIFRVHYIPFLVGDRQGYGVWGMGAWGVYAAGPAAATSDRPHTRQCTGGLKGFSVTRSYPHTHPPIEISCVGLATAWPRLLFAH